MELTLDLDLLTPADWNVLRDARLEALGESPHAFTSSYVSESRWEEAEWRQLFSTSTWIVAREEDRVVGLARSVGEPGEPWMRHLESIWVAPDYRRRGVLRALLRSLAEMDRGSGVTFLMLWVLEDNDAAQRAYEALGFVPTGERQYLPPFDRFEWRLQLGIRSLADSVPTTRGFGVG
jgi:ribosomal protein S18 acetylase RimI-like enzyme